MAADQDVQAYVQALYEAYPYPRPVEDLTPVLSGQQVPAWNPRDSSALYYPEGRDPREPLEVLIAGCGTNTGPQHAAALPQLRFTAIDISRASLAHARRVSEAHGLDNIRFHELPLERVAELGQTFDFVSCHGVLHHLADPVAGLRALAAVTRPNGVLSLMVYGRHGRAGLYLLQELFRDRLGSVVGDRDLTAIQSALTQLPPEHPFRILHRQREQAIDLGEIADMLLHPRDRGYSVGEVRQLIEGAGVVFQRWLGQAHYRPELSPLAHFPGLQALDGWGRAEALELFYGTIIKHEFAVRPAGAVVPQLGMQPDLLPQLSQHLKVTRAEASAVLVNTQHQIPFQVTLRAGRQLKLLAGVDGRRSIAELGALASRELGNAVGQARDLEFFDRLAAADLVNLREP